MTIQDKEIAEIKADIKIILERVNRVSEDMSDLKESMEDMDDFLFRDSDSVSYQLKRGQEFQQKLEHISGGTEMEELRSTIRIGKTIKKTQWLVWSGVVSSMVVVVMTLLSCL